MKKKVRQFKFSNDDMIIRLYQNIDVKIIYLNKIILLFADEDKKCEDKETWCETSKPKCVDEIKEKCPKYCGICKGMNQQSK